jgi:hypothetical protein
MIPALPVPTDEEIARILEHIHGRVIGLLRDGATHLLLDPGSPGAHRETLRTDCPSSVHLLRFHGVLAPRSRLRSEVVPLSSREPEHGGGPPRPGPSAPATRPPPSCGAGSLSWAALMKRVFALDVVLCPRCGGRRRIVAGYPGGQRLRDLLDRLERSEPTAAGASP